MKYDVMINGIPTQAEYSDRSIREIFLPLLLKLDQLQKEKKGRVLALLAAPPGAGKSTLLEFLKTLTEMNPVKLRDLMPQGVSSLPEITVIGMDGFHRYQEDLLAHTTIRNGEEISLVKIKGAPMTFDLAALTDRVRRVAMGEECDWPIYDRMNHNPRDNALTVSGKIVILEGNYLLLDEDGWRNLASYADYTIFLGADLAQLRTRLVERKMATVPDRATAEHFVDYSDLENAKTVLNHSQNADLTLIWKENEIVKQDQEADIG